MLWQSADSVEKNLAPTYIQKQNAAQKNVQPVYDISVNSGCFYANGILVSNCDVVRYLCTTIRKKSRGPHESKFKDKFGKSSKAAILGHNASVGKITIRY
jgi:hypothetical protein